MLSRNSSIVIKFKYMLRNFNKLVTNFLKLVIRASLDYGEEVHQINPEISPEERLFEVTIDIANKMRKTKINNQNSWRSTFLSEGLRLLKKLDL